MRNVPLGTLSHVVVLPVVHVAVTFNKGLSTSFTTKLQFNRLFVYAGLGRICKDAIVGVNPMLIFKAPEVDKGVSFRNVESMQAIKAEL